jgi:hypothetical protein
MTPMMCAGREIPTSYHSGGLKASCELKDLQLWRLRSEVESGLGEEAVDEAGPVLHPCEPGLHQRGQLIDALLGEVGQRSLQVRPDGLDRIQLRRMARLVWVGRLSQIKAIALPSR